MSEYEGSDERIEEIHKLVKKNNRMVRRMYEAQRRAAFFRMVHWLVIIVLAIIAYIYIEPYITQLENLYSSAQEASTRMQSVIDQATSATERFTE